MLLNRKAFTLIELLITIAIIAILTAVAALSYTGIQQRGRDAQRKSDLNIIKVTLSTYYNAQVPVQYAPSSNTSVSVPCMATTGSCGVDVINGSTDLLTTTLSPLYLRAMPTDPKNTGIYIYKYTSSALNSIANQSFNLSATLENTNDHNGWNAGSGWVADGFNIYNN